jgi:hypothetical protein
MSFEDVVQSHFSGSLPEKHFVRRAAVTLIQQHGFTPTNTLACVGVCRDELCRSLFDEVEEMWGQAFDVSSLAGILTIGRTGFAAARAHAPLVQGRSRFVFFLFAHIGISPAGELGVAMRPGREEPSAACGALVALQADRQAGETSSTVDWADPEQSYLRSRLARFRDLGPEAELLELTRAAHRASVEDLGGLMSAAVDQEREDYAVVAGIQIHGPDGNNLTWPGASHVVVRGVRSEIWF